jgi:hypothetical protein
MTKKREYKFKVDKFPKMVISVKAVSLAEAKKKLEKLLRESDK